VSPTFSPDPVPAPEERAVDAGVFRTAFGVVILGALVALAMYVWGRSADMEPTRLIRNGLYVNIGLYIVVAAFVFQRVQKVSFRPVWTEGDAAESLMMGLLVGGGLATGLLILSRLATGHVVTDGGIELIVSERTVARIGAAFLLACMAAPWVEELLFRGLVTESLRPWGLKAAATASGAMFAIWHPQALFPLLDALFGGGESGSWFPFFYYLAMGALFSRLYMRRGLKCSIAAHTAFNGIIVLTAVVMQVAPGHVIAANGVTARVPASWHMASDPALVARLDMVVEGPSGSGMLVSHITLPPGGAITADRAAAILASGADTGGVVVDPGGSRRVDYPMGQALRVSATAEGHHAEIVVIPRDGVLWQVILMSGGSSRAEADFDAILEHMQLPTTPTVPQA
jgi:membrane protease YdiL (CAAX protease family)